MLTLTSAGIMGCGTRDDLTDYWSGTRHSSSTGGTAATGGSTGAVYALPPNFTATEFGGYALGNRVDTGSIPTGTADCSAAPGAIVTGVVRDFLGSNSGGHPDFEASFGGVTQGLVLASLGSDSKPVYAGVCDGASADPVTCPYGPALTTKADFDEWYRNSPNVNQPYLVRFSLEPNGRVLTFQSDHYFPVDGSGFKDELVDQDGTLHNYSFTTEIHFTFHYDGGERLVFSGDDDLWVFINGRLAVDLGGLHANLLSTLHLDGIAATLGIAKGGTYGLDLFSAERHSTGSSLRFDTDLQLVNCGTILP